LEWLLDQALTIHDRRHYVVSNKGDVVVGPDGQALDDDGVKLEALKLIKALSESRRVLRGLDAPKRKQVEFIDADTVEAEIRRLNAEMAANDPAVGA
jgi:hypothetical protein